eukprot:TRINITY_DN69473_c0_g1_i1.p1 TRINITY_DN69473_c0_g1~~TRINITY_DN69473_c0_g1_i1.p1  ORF type:complete len:488 (+),score=108.10 TRINITY_DN69473_c0_g1_i1:53-1465(+)
MEGVAPSPYALEVSIIRATGMHHMNFTGDAIWCACEVKHSEPRHENARVQTRPIKKTLDPEWNETFEIFDWCVGEPLEFVLYDQGMITSKKEGSVRIPSEQFFPNGLEGILPVPGLDNATIELRIVPFDPSAEENMPAEEASQQMNEIDPRYGLSPEGAAHDSFEQDPKHNLSMEGGKSGYLEHDPREGLTIEATSPNGLHQQSDMDMSPQAPQTKHELRRAEKGYAQNVMTVQHRIDYFKREEERIWRGLEDVRRQAAKMEECRNRLREREAAENAVKQLKYRTLMENRIRAKGQREEIIRQRKQNTLETMQAKRYSSMQQKNESRELENRKRMGQVEQRRSNSERVISSQRDTIVAKLRSNQERSERLTRIREEQEYARLEAQRDAERVGGRLPDLEAQELACLQRLQNSRIVEQTVLQELEASLGVPLSGTLRNRHSRATNYVDMSQDPSQSFDSKGQVADSLSATG